VKGDLSADCSDLARLSRDSIHAARHDTDRTVLLCLALHGTGPADPAAPGYFDKQDFFAFTLYIIAFVDVK